eukprot:4917603-Ditylum_brightwellii.AAC.1
MLQATNLPTIVKLHMPYKTKEGLNTSLKIATGNNIANAIVGYPFLSAVGFKLDLKEGEIKSHCHKAPYG